MAIEFTEFSIEDLGIDLSGGLSNAPGGGGDGGNKGGLTVDNFISLDDIGFGVPMAYARRKSSVARLGEDPGPRPGSRRMSRLGSRSGSISNSPRLPSDSEGGPIQPIAPAVPNVDLSDIGETLQSFTFGSAGAAAAGSPRPPTDRTVTMTSVLRKGVDEDGNKMINDYIILGNLGAGAYGKVKLAMNKNTDAPCAIKIMNKSILAKVQKNAGTSALDAVRSEVAVMKKLDHPNVVKLFELIDDPTNNKMFLVLEYLDNGPVIRKGEIIPFDQLRIYAFELSEALFYMHANKILHRDIKPENILVSKEGVVKLTDFGVSSQTDSKSSDKVMAGEGTPAFWSPECARGGLISGKAADVWALGVTFYVMAFADMPFKGDNVQDLSNSIINDPLQIPPCEEKDFVDLLEKMLEKDPRLRITTSDILLHPFVSTVLDGRSIEDIIDEWTVVTDEISEEEKQRAVVVGNNVQLPLATSVSIMMKVKRAFGGRLSKIKQRLRQKAAAQAGETPREGEDEETDNPLLRLSSAQSMVSTTNADGKDMSPRRMDSGTFGTRECSFHESKHGEQEGESPKFSRRSLQSAAADSDVSGGSPGVAVPKLGASGTLNAVASTFSSSDGSPAAPQRSPRQVGFNLTPRSSDEPKKEPTTVIGNPIQTQIPAGSSATVTVREAGAAQARGNGVHGPLAGTGLVVRHPGDPFFRLHPEVERPNPSPRTVLPAGLTPRRAAAEVLFTPTEAGSSPSKWSRLAIENAKNPEVDSAVDHCRRQKSEGLSLYGLKFAILPTQIATLSHLKTLECSFNGMSIVGPELGELVNLTCLKLTNNFIVQLPEEIGRLTELVELDLSCNELSILPSGVVRLHKLQRVNLDDNCFSMVPYHFSMFSTTPIKVSMLRNPGLRVNPSQASTHVELIVESSAESSSAVSAPSAESTYPVLIREFLYLGVSSEPPAPYAQEGLGITQAISCGSRDAKVKLAPCVRGQFLIGESDTDIDKYFENTNKLISEARAQNGRVLVHCSSKGFSLSATIVCAYLMGVESYRFTLALDQVKKALGNVDLSNACLDALQAYNRKLGLPRKFGASSATSPSSSPRSRK